MIRWMMVLLGSSVGGAIGWWLGAFAGQMTAFFVSLVGTAAGVYFANRLARHYLP